MKMAGIFKEDGGSLIFFDKRFRMTDRNQAVFFAGEEEDVVRERKITDGGMSRKLSDFRGIASGRRAVSATCMSQAENLFKKSMIMRNKKKPRGNIIDDISRDETLKRGNGRKKFRSASRNRPEEDELAID